MSRRVLILQPPDARLGESLTDALHRHAPTLSADLTDAAQETISHLVGSGYDAAVCWAEKPEELEVVVRLRQAVPQMPIVLVSSQNDEAFRTLARERGASAVVPNARNLSLLVGLIEQ